MRLWIPHSWYLQGAGTTGGNEFSNDKGKSNEENMGKRKFVEDDEVDEGDLSDSEDVNKWVTNNGEGQNGKSSSKEEERP